MHEVLLHPFEPLSIAALTALTEMDDTTFASNLNKNIEAWEALDPNCLARLDGNYVKWARNYALAIPDVEASDEELRKMLIA